MQSEGISTTVALTGMLPFIVLLAAALSLPLCFALLRLYRAALLKGMDARAGSEPRATQIRAATPPPDSTLAVAQLEQRPDTTQPAVRRASRAPWRSAAVYAAGGIAYAAVMTVGWLSATHEPVGWGKFVILFWVYLWPAVLAVWLVAAYDRTRRWQLLGAYVAVFVALSLHALARSPNLTPLQLPLLWLLMNGPASVLLVTFLWRPIRAVGPLVLVFLLMVAIGSQSVLTVASTIPGWLEPIAHAGFAIGLGGTQVFWAMILVGIGAFAVLGWPLLRWIGRRYERKQFSDQSISIDALFVLFGVVQSIGLAFEGPLWIFTGLVAFAACKSVTLLSRRALRAGREAPRTLLLLRVFRLGKRSEQLFDKLRKHWQAVGSITMIAGPDLATTTVEPHEFLDFLSGRLGRQFVSGAQDLERRIAAMDRAPDPDARYRINEFFCRADTWQSTMQRLAAQSDAVLMDLRSFSPANQGCLFELGRLLDVVDLARVVFLVDQTTDRAFLEASLQRLWRELSADSPNRAAASPTARLFVGQDQSEQTLRALLSHLLVPVPSQRA